MPNCKQCNTGFEVTDEDLKVYQRFDVPEPTMCPDCRKQRRLAFRNENKLYRRDCDLCHKSMVTAYSPDKPLTVYCPECWWGDKWDPLEYGQEFDFNRPFFEQFKELFAKAPLLSNTVFNSTNCEFNSSYIKSVPLWYAFLW